MQIHTDLITSEYTAYEFSGGGGEKKEEEEEKKTDAENVFWGIFIKS